MKNRKLLLIVSLVLAMTMSLGGTLAYLSDTDADVNVMTLGKVTIEQHEYQRVGDETDTYTTKELNGKTGYELEDFQDNKMLLPIVGDPNEPSDSPAYKGWDDTRVYMDQVDSYGNMQVFEGKNAVDKFVTVENTGNTPAYVRTFVALEVGSTENKNADGKNLVMTAGRYTYKAEEAVTIAPWMAKSVGIVEINGNNYSVIEMTYVGAKLSDGTIRHEGGKLPGGDTTYPSLTQVYLKHYANNEDVVALDGNANGTYDILVLSQAVQADGFVDAKTALEAGFGEATADNVKKWFEGEDVVNELPVIKTVKDADELKKALEEVETGTTIVLADNIKTDVVIAEQARDHKITIDGNGYTFDGVITVNGKSARYEGAGLTIQDVNFKSDEISKDAVIRFGTGENDSRYVNNIVISNCTFDVKDAVAVKSYTGGDTNVLIENCTVSERMHSLCQLKNVEEGLVIRNCTVKALRGANLNNTYTALIEGCTFDVQKYAVRFGSDAGVYDRVFTIKDTTLKSKNVDNDPVIEFRAGSVVSTLNLENTTIEAAEGIKIQGNTEQTTINGTY